MTLTLKEARVLIDTAMSAAAELGQVVAIAVLDANGRLISMDQADGALLHRDRMAVGKANASVILGVPTADLADLSKDNPTRFHGLLAMFSGEIYLSGGGGVPLHTPGGDFVGALGISGGKHGTDDKIADAAIAAWHETF